jgi:DNA-binding response OmpR family regulator
MSHILVVEDDMDMQKSIMRGLLKAGYKVTTLEDGLAARLYDLSDIDLVLLDWQLPKFDGINVLKYWRSKNIQTPVLLLTARGSIDDIVVGLNSGSDDYISKTFAWPELLARIYSQLKHKIKVISTLETIKLDRINEAFFENSQLIKFTKTEYNLLKFFFDHSSELITTSKLIHAIWPNTEINSNVIARHIKSIRSKLNYDPILTIKNMGYRLKPNQASPKVTVSNLDHS